MIILHPLFWIPAFFGVLGMVTSGPPEFVSGAFALAALAFIFLRVLELKNQRQLTRAIEKQREKLEPFRQKKRQMLASGDTTEELSVDVKAIYDQTVQTIKFGGKLNNGGWDSNEVLQFLALHGIREEDFDLPQKLQEAIEVDENSLNGDSEFKREINEARHKREKKRIDDANKHKRRLIDNLRESFPKHQDLQNWLMKNLKDWIKEEIISGKEFPLEFLVKYHKETKEFAMADTIIDDLKALNLPIDDKYGPFNNHTRNEIFATIFENGGRYSVFEEFLSKNSLRISAYDDHGRGQLLKLELIDAGIDK